MRKVCREEKRRQDEKIETIKEKKMKSHTQIDQDIVATDMPELEKEVLHLLIDEKIGNWTLAFCIGNMQPDHNFKIIPSI